MLSWLANHGLRIASTGRVFCHEHPRKSTQIRDSALSVWEKSGIVSTRNLAQCAYGAMYGGKAVQKATTLTHSSGLRLSGLPCNGRHEHHVLQGKDPETGLHCTALASKYPKRLCESLVKDFVKYIKTTDPDHRLHALIFHSCPRCNGNMAAEHTRVRGCREWYRRPSVERARREANNRPSRRLTSKQPLPKPETGQPRRNPERGNPESRGDISGQPGPVRGKQRSISPESYQKELDKLKDQTTVVKKTVSFGPSPKTEDEVDKFINARGNPASSERIHSRLPVPLMHDHASVAYVLGKAFALLHEEDKVHPRPKLVGPGSMKSWYGLRKTLLAPGILASSWK